MKSTQAIASFVFATGVSAFWRMPCRSQTGFARIDPIMDPGEISDHVHTITGGGNFGMNTTYADLTADGSCTACEVTQDHSAYWTPALYFTYSNGSTVMVPQVGGMLAYYLYYLDNVTAFQEGFQMVAGNKYLRSFDGPFPDTPLSSWPTYPSDQFFLEQRAIGFNCLNYDITPEPSLYRHVLPSKTQLDNDCIDGLRLELAFPSCGNGSLDSSDHKSHVQYPSLVKEGNCPDDYPVHLPFLFYETIWATNDFAGDDGEFALSMGDPTGSGYHGDFIMGWESADFLQSALDTCTNESGEIQDCDLFTIQSDAVGAECTFTMPESLEDDDVKGPRDGLPVDVPMQYGPANATSYPCAGRSGAATSSVASSLTSTYSQTATLSYSAADASVTSTALGGIVVAAYSGTASTSSSSVASSYSVATSSSPSVAPSYSAASATITSSPSLSDASPADAIATNWSTSGNEVLELVIEEVNVTVTAEATTTAYAKHRRHLDHHKRHQHHL